MWIIVEEYNNYIYYDYFENYINLHPPQICSANTCWQLKTRRKWVDTKTTSELGLATLRDVNNKIYKVNLKNIKILVLLVLTCYKVGYNGDNEYLILCFQSSN